MLTSRRLEKENGADWQQLLLSLLHDEFHTDTPLQFFEEPGTITNIYSWEGKDMLYARGKPVLHDDKTALRLDIQFLSNRDFRNNVVVMSKGFPLLVERARNSGFSCILFESSVPLLQRFCIKTLGFSLLIDNWLIFTL